MRNQLRGSISAKFIAAFLACIILPLAVIATVYSYNLQHLLMENERQNTAAKIDAGMMQVEQILQEMSDIISQLSINNSVAAILRSGQAVPTYEWFQEFRAFENLLQTVAAKSNRNYGVAAISSSGKVYYTGGMYNAYLTLDDPICRAILNANGAMVTVNRILSGIDGEPVLTVGKAFMDRGTVQGVALVDTPTSLLDAIFGIFDPAHTHAYVLGRDGSLLYTREPAGEAPIGTQALVPLLADTSGETEIDGIEYIAIHKSSGRPALSILVLVPKAFIFQEPNRLTQQLVLALAATLLLTVVIIVATSSAIARNIRRLSGAVASFGKAERELTIPVASVDEVGQLARGIEAMSRRIIRLLATVREDEHTKWDLEFKALQSQINPHMIYNTLNTIANLAHLQNVPNIEEVSTAAVHLLRMVSNRNDEFIPLREELECVQAFMTIKQYNQPWDVTLQIDADDAVREIPILKLLLQPLVENAIVHGFTGKLPGGTIRVQAAVEGGLVRIEISDDGEGMDGQTLQGILSNQFATDKAFSNVGIYNTWRRLALKYGEAASFDIQSRVMGGTTVRIAYPADAADAGEGRP